MVGAVMMVTGLYVYSAYLPLGTVYASTMTLTMLAVIQWFNAWSCRSEHQSILRIPLFSNMYMWYATLIVFLLQYTVISYPPLQKIMNTTSLSLHDWLLIVILSLSVIGADEIRKFFVRMVGRIEKL